MAGSLNRVQLIGNLGRDPEVRTTQSGTRIASFSLATAESWKDRTSGERKERTTWHNIVIFNEGLAKVAEQYLHKGDKVFIEGAIQQRKWTDQQGAERVAFEIVLSSYGGQLIMLSGPAGRGGGRSAPQSRFDGSGDNFGESDFGETPGASARPATTRDALDDDIPF